MPARWRAAWPKAGSPSTGAQLLQSNASLRVFVVGLTDNQGAPDGNLALSKARAQAVVDAPAKNRNVDAKRLAAAGVANYVPVASNAGDAGRVRNRRVELVLQGGSGGRYRA